MNRPFKKGSRGFTLLLAALIASITLALGTSIFTIAQKEVALASIGKDSQYAFYAADTAAECALYWDYRYKFFELEPADDAPANPTCAGRPICTGDAEDDCTRRSSYPQTMTFQFEPNGYCALVTVFKRMQGNALRTTIHADGYSTTCAQRETTPRALERSVELNY